MHALAMYAMGGAHDTGLVGINGFMSKGKDKVHRWMQREQWQGGRAGLGVCGGRQGQMGKEEWNAAGQGQM